MENLIELWESSELITYDKKALESIKLMGEQSKFLNQVGLPADAAPFLSFNPQLETLNESYYLEDPTYDSKIVLGSDGSGNPICLDLIDMKIYACDHEMEFKVKFMNSSPKKLFKSLSYFKAFIDELIEQNSEDEDYDCKFSDEQLNDLMWKFKSNDSLALENDNFWFIEIQTLKANREYYMKTKH